jgi:protein-tyrosine-phosphatase
MLPIAVITIVFVCEHGAAKSVVAAAEFNCLAEERHLPDRAIARGTEPQAEIAPSAANGLRADGLPVPPDPPQKLTADDVAHATRVVAFCDVPPELAKNVTRWDVPAVGDGYEKARDEIVAHLQSLLSELRR